MYYTEVTAVLPFSLLQCCLVVSHVYAIPTLSSIMSTQRLRHIYIKLYLRCMPNFCAHELNYLQKSVQNVFQLFFKIITVLLEALLFSLTHNSQTNSSFITIYLVGIDRHPHWAAV